MYLIDFVYDGIKLSDLGCMVGSIVTGIEESVDMGSVISFDTIINHGSYITEIVNADYKDVYTCTFDIFRKPCGNFSDNLSDKEVSWFMRWLNRKEYCKFIPIYDDKHSFYRLYMMGTFNEIKAIIVGGNVVGFTLTLITNAPFAFLDYKPIVYKNVTTFTIFDESEELGSVYPKSFKVTAKENVPNYTLNGKTYEKCLYINNSLDSSHITLISNTSTNETYTFDCIHKIITSSLGNGHLGGKLYNDFNYNFPRLINTVNNKKNIFTLPVRCDVEVEYHPIRKVGVV